MQSIVVEVTGLKKDERRDYVDASKTKVTYDAEFKNPDVVGSFYATMRFAAPADAPRIGDKFLLTLVPVVDIPEVAQESRTIDLGALTPIKLGV